MSEGGVSASYVDSQIRQVQSHIDAVERALGSEIRSNSNAISRLEAEMSDLANAIRSMTAELRAQLETIAEHSREANTTLERTLAANVAGFAANTAATVKVDGSVRESTQTQVQMEYLRLYNEARTQLVHLEGFAAEIDERFARAVVNVHLNRELYDGHFTGILAEFENKKRAIGGHIYRILEEDFVPTVEERLQIPKSAYQELGIEIDQQLLEARSEKLDLDLEQFRQRVLDPVINLQREFETLLASKYATDPVADASVPMLGIQHDDGRTELIIAATVVEVVRRTETPERLPAQGLGFHLEHDPSFEPYRTAAEAGLRQVSNALTSRGLRPDEIGQLKHTLADLARRGLMSEELLGGYYEYLDIYGLEVFDGAPLEVGVRRGSPPPFPSTRSAASDLLPEASQHGGGTR